MKCKGCGKERQIEDIDKEINVWGEDKGLCQSCRGKAYLLIAEMIE